MTINAGGAVSSWRDVVAGLEMKQSDPGCCPIWSSSSFNSHPGLTFDGVDDCLTIAPSPFAGGALACEIWVVLQQDAQVDDEFDDNSGTMRGDNLGRQAFSWGNTTANNARVVGRYVRSSTNRARAYIGQGSSSPSPSIPDLDFSFRHVVRLQIGPTRSILTVDGTHVATTAAMPATSGARMRIGANSRNVPGGFWMGQITDCVICDLLEPVE
jgi:hypothetical protein